MKYLLLFITALLIAASSWAQPPKAFKQCANCHKVAAGKHGVGPSLFGVYGRTAGTAHGYTYSGALADSGIMWNDRSLDQYLRDPKA